MRSLPFCKDESCPPRCRFLWINSRNAKAQVSRLLPPSNFFGKEIACTLLVKRKWATFGASTFHVKFACQFFLTSTVRVAFGSRLVCGFLLATYWLLNFCRTEREKVRVTFFQQSKPQEVDLPDEPLLFSEGELMMAAATLNETNHISYNRTERYATIFFSKIAALKNS